MGNAEIQRVRGKKAHPSLGLSPTSLRTEDINQYATLPLACEAVAPGKQAALSITTRTRRLISVPATTSGQHQSVYTFSPVLRPVCLLG